jgi:hypothetical protein
LLLGDFGLVFDALPVHVSPAAEHVPFTTVLDPTVKWIVTCAPLCVTAIGPKVPPHLYVPW